MGQTCQNEPNMPRQIKLYIPNFCALAVAMPISGARCDWQTGTFPMSSPLSGHASIFPLLDISPNVLQGTCLPALPFALFLLLITSGWQLYQYGGGQVRVERTNSLDQLGWKYLTFAIFTIISDCVKILLGSSQEPRRGWCRWGTVKLTLYSIKGNTLVSPLYSLCQCFKMPKLKCQHLE